MIRNPFLKDDMGCSFLCFLFIFLLIQLVYFSAYMQPSFLKIEYDIKSREQVIDDTFLLIPCSIFYLFSVLWVVAFL